MAVLQVSAAEMISLVQPLSAEEMYIISQLSTKEMLLTHHLSGDQLAIIQKLAAHQISISEQLSTDKGSIMHQLSTHQISTIQQLSAEQTAFIQQLSASQMSVIRNAVAKLLNMQRALGAEAHVTPPATTELSPFKRLPPELRTYIYELALKETEPIDIKSKTTMNNKGERVSTLSYSSPCALAETCRSIRAECLKMYFKYNTFVIHLNQPVFHEEEKFKDREELKAWLDTGEPMFLRYWHEAFKPMLRLNKVLERMDLSNIYVHVDIGTFTFDPHWRIYWLRSILNRISSALDRPGGLFRRDECLLKFTIVVDDLDRCREEISCNVRVSDRVEDLGAISDFFRARSGMTRGNAVRMRLLSQNFAVLRRRL